MSLLSKISNFLGYAEKPVALSVPEIPIQRVPTSVPYRQLLKMRKYDAAVPSLTNADFAAFNTTGNYEIWSGSRRIRYYARDLDRNNPFMAAFLRELSNNVIGADGIRLQSKVRNLRGSSYNDKLNVFIQDQWAEFNKLGTYEVTGKFSGLTADELLMRSLARDGEVLIKIIRGYPNKFRVALELVECDSLDLFYTVSALPNGNSVVMGVELDPYGRPVAYHLLKQPMQDLFASGTNLGQRSRIPAEDMIHLFVPRRITENRGMSWAANVITKLRHLERTEEYMVVANRSAAAKMGFLTRTAEAATKYKGQGETATGEIIEELSAGEIIELPVGYDFKSFDPGVPNTSYPEFRKSLLRTVAGGLGVMYNTLGQDMESVNYSSARFSKESEIYTWKSLQRFYIEHFKQPVFNAWIEMAIMSGAIPDIPFDQVSTIQGSMLWRPKGYSYIDPLTDIQAACMAIDAGLSTRRRELAELGLTPEEVFEELAAEKKLADKYGLTFTTPETKAAILTRPMGFDGPPQAPKSGNGTVMPQPARK